jgi:DNA-binding NarL/FixJ family response regulator
MTQTKPCRMRVLVADDHAIMRAGLERLIDNRPEMCICGTAADGVGTLARLQDTPCDVLLLDLSMPPPNGPELIAEVRRRKPDLPILIMSMHSDPAVVRAAVEAGASGYITKGSDPETLAEALRCTVRGEHYVEPRLAAAMVFASDRSAAPQALSAREREVLRYLAAGKSNAEIARALFLSEKTVSSHKMNIMAKLNVTSLAELVHYADRRLLDERPER